MMAFEHDIRRAGEWLRGARRLVVFTGAGVSAESGIPTFRDDEGLWREFPPEQFANWQGLARTALARPREFARFAHAVIGPIAAAEPNAAHRAIAAAESRTPTIVVTQNIDCLHSFAGSSIVHEIHGSLYNIVDRRGQPLRMLSRDTMREIARRLEQIQGRIFSLVRLAVAARPLLGLGMHGFHRPNLVLFGDALAEPAWSAALAAAAAADVMLVVGTSGNVFPANILPGLAKENDARVIVVDPHEGGGDVWLRGEAVDVVPALFDAAHGDRR